MAVKLPKPKSETDLRYVYDRELLDMALRETEEQYGPYHISYASSAMSHKRTRVEIGRGRLINVVRSPTNADLEVSTIPVRIPIFMGLLGYRVALIRAEDQARFNKILSLQDLAALRAGQGAGWVDIPILQKNGLSVVKGANYDSLFGMLSAGRFDYFPRGVNEILTELETHRDQYPSLSTEKTLLLHYPFPVYFFVSKKQPNLAKRLYQGLSILAERGDLERLLYRYFGQQIKKLNLAKRRVFYLKNPDLPSQTPLAARHLWFNPLDARAKENPAQG